MIKTEVLKNVLFAARKVKKKHYSMLQVRKENYPEKQCLWCNQKISGSKSFCSEDCKDQHSKAIENYERRRQDKEHMRYSR